MTLKIAGLLLIAALSTVAVAKPNYSEGQMWAYKTRPQDKGSLLKIQRVENFPDPEGREKVYHISVIDVRLANPGMASELPHFPVSKQTLDASVTRLVRTSRKFPDPTEGIAEWRSARGGVFTISVAEIVGIIDQQTNQPLP